MATHPERLLARAADDATMTGEERAELERHLEACGSCRDALEAQRNVSLALRARAESQPAAGFAARVAARLDRDCNPGGLLDVANWRAWTVGLAPVAAALLLAAYLGVGGSSTQATSGTDVTFDAWTAPTGETSPASVFLQPSATVDQLLETVLTGTAPATSGGASDVR